MVRRQPELDWNFVMLINNVRVRGMLRGTVVFLPIDDPDRDIEFMVRLELAGRREHVYCLFEEGGKLSLVEGSGVRFQSSDEIPVLMAGDRVRLKRRNYNPDHEGYGLSSIWVHERNALEIERAEQALQAAGKVETPKSAPVPVEAVPVPAAVSPVELPPVSKASSKKKKRKLDIDISELHGEDGGYRESSYARKKREQRMEARTPVMA
jgi:hypothetical protein